MNIAECVAAIPPLFAAKVVPFLWGPASSGKTSIVELVARELKGRRIPLHLAYQSQADLLGMMYLEEGRTRWALPSWWPDPGTVSILHLDEYNRADDPAVIGAAMQLVLERRFHVHELPESAHIIASGNPSGSGYAVIAMDDLAQISRFCHIHVTMDPEEYIAYAVRTQQHPSVLGYLSAHPSAIDADDDPPPKLKILPRRRTWEFLAGFLSHGGDRLPGHVIEEVARGLIGADHTNLFFSKDEDVSADDMIDMTDEDVASCVGALRSARRIDKLMLLAQNIVSAAKAGRMEMPRMIDILEAMPQEITRSVLERAVRDQAFAGKLKDYRERIRKILNDRI